MKDPDRERMGLCLYSHQSDEGFEQDGDKRQKE